MNKKGKGGNGPGGNRNRTLKKTDFQINCLELRVLLLLGKTVSPRLKSVLGASTTVLNRILTLDEVLDGRIAVDFVLVAKVLLDSAIDFSDGIRSISRGFSELDPGRSKTLAVTAPWGKELHSHGPLGELNVKDLSGERKNTLGLILLRLLLSGLLGGLLLLLLLGGLLSHGLSHVVHVSFNGARDLHILKLAAIGDELDGGIATDTVVLGKILLNSAIDLSNVEFAFGLLSELDPGGSETLAVTTPGGKELDEPETFLGLLIKVVSSENLNL